MHIFEAAQPALLYLSPACIIAIYGMAVYRGELSTVWSYQDGEAEETERKRRKELKVEESHDSSDSRTEMLPHAPKPGTTVPNLKSNGGPPLSAVPDGFLTDDEASGGFSAGGGPLRQRRLSKQQR